MDTQEALKTRRSIRAFTKEVPDRETIRECLEAATWAPSATNQQPWEFIVLTGVELKQVCDLIEERFAEDLGDIDPFGNLPDVCRERQQEIMTTLMQIAHEEGIDGNEIFERSLRFFDAPVGVYFVTYKRNDNQYAVSVAAAIENFLLAARARGLGTCWLTVTVVCREALKKYLGLPEDKELAGGVALGYPDMTSPFNTFPRTREPVDACTFWKGFT